MRLDTLLNVLLVGVSGALVALMLGAVVGSNSPKPTVRTDSADQIPDVNQMISSNIPKATDRADSADQIPNLPRTDRDTSHRANFPDVNKMIIDEHTTVIPETSRSEIKEDSSVPQPPPPNPIPTVPTPDPPPPPVAPSPPRATPSPPLIPPHVLISAKALVAQEQKDKDVCARHGGHRVDITRDHHPSWRCVFPAKHE